MPKGIYKHRSSQGFQKGHVTWNKGKPLPQIMKRKIVAHNKFRTGERNVMWKGDDVGYDALHNWVVRKKGKPMICEICKIKGLKSIKYHWANLSGKYRRNINDWKRMCAKCHKLYDKTWLRRKRNKLGRFI